MNSLNKNELKLAIIRRFRDEGFETAGMAKATFLEPEAKKLSQWIENGFHAGMTWMTRSSEKRTDPRKLLDDCKTVICGLFNYYQPDTMEDKTYRVAKYALGRDYHDVLSVRLKRIEAFIQDAVPGCRTRVSVDSEPVMEKAWAQRCGLGWIGRNGLLINPGSGSFLFIGTILTDIELDPDEAAGEHCGNCNRCMEACPNGAIVNYGVIDARKCIACLTIEHKGDFTAANSTANWIFGCDICQDVCPYNVKAQPHQCNEFDINPQIMKMGADNWRSLDGSAFNALFAGSAIKRTGFKRMVRNIRNVVIY